jgi:predicted RNase H-like HicB family nuclease
MRKEDSFGNVFIGVDKAVFYKEIRTSMSYLANHQPSTGKSNHALHPLKPPLHREHLFDPMEPSTIHDAAATRAHVNAGVHGCRGEPAGRKANDGRALAIGDVPTARYEQLTAHPAVHMGISTFGKSYNRLGWRVAVQAINVGEMEPGDRRMGKREFYVVIERDEDGFYVGEVPQLRACYSQGRTLDELMENVREAILLCLEDEGDEGVPEFVGVQRVAV